MHKNILIYFLVLATAVVACKKNDDDSTSVELRGTKWSGKMLTPNYQYTNRTAHLTFNADSTMSGVVDTNQTATIMGTWRVKPDKTVLFTFSFNNHLSGNFAGFAAFNSDYTKLIGGSATNGDNKYNINFNMTRD